MKTNRIQNICLLLSLLALMSCGGDKLEKKGFSVASVESTEQSTSNHQGIHKDSLKLETRPGSVLLTGMPEYRLTTIYKVNYNKDKKSFIGSNSYHSTYNEASQSAGNQWNYHYMPGFEALSGYNLINVSHYDVNTNKQKTFFEKPVLVRTLYYPSFAQDTLNYQPVKRNFFMLSVYDEDTNKDGRVDMRDLRRFYYFDKMGNNKRALIPANYSALKSEYDAANDYFYIFAYQDDNNNGQQDQQEPHHIFWVDLKNPERNGRLY